MTSPDWHLLSDVDAGRLGEARVQAHYAAQWLARAARAFIAPRPADGHTNLGWDKTFGGLRTHRLPDGSRLGLRFADLTLVLLGETRSDAPPRLSLAGRRDTDVRAWLGEVVHSLGLSARALDELSPYEMPAHPIASGGAYAPGLAEPLRMLAAWYGNASQVLASVRDRLIARGVDAPGVRCWPHHFDLDTLIYFPGKTSNDVRTMGVGFSPGDEYYDEPYFYVSVYPAPAAGALPPLPEVGHWHVHEFTAAVAPSKRILPLEDQQAEVTKFLSAATDIGSTLLR